MQSMRTTACLMVFATMAIETSSLSAQLVPASIAAAKATGKPLIAIAGSAS